MLTELKKRWIIYFLVSFSFVLSCSSEVGKRVYYPEWGFSICFPDGWKIRKGDLGTVVLAEVPPENDSAAVKENISVFIHQLKIPVTLDEYLQRQMSSFKKLRTIKDITLQEKGDAVIDGSRAKWQIYRYTIASMRFQSVVFYIEKAGKFYVITGLSEIDNFPRYRKTFDAAARSFRFL